MRNSASTVAVFLTATLFSASATRAGEIRHKFVATDESGKQLLFVDETDSTKDWTVPLQGNRDLQLTGKASVIVSVPTGYREYSLDGGKLIKEVKAGNGIQSLFRLANGNTLLASKKQVLELDQEDKTLATHDLDLSAFFRLLRLTRQGNLLYVSGKSEISERKLGGDIVRRLDVAELTPETSKPYSIEEMDDGTFVASTGYGATLLVLTKDWKLSRAIGGKGKIKDIDTHFFADFQRLENGNIVVAHWSGHNRRDSEKAPQAIEFNKDGEVVWTWHDPARAGSLHGIEIIE